MPAAPALRQGAAAATRRSAPHLGQRARPAGLALRGLGAVGGRQPGGFRAAAGAARSEHAGRRRGGAGGPAAHDAGAGPPRRALLRPLCAARAPHRWVLSLAGGGVLCAGTEGAAGLAARLWAISWQPAKSRKGTLRARVRAGACLPHVPSLLPLRPNPRRLLSAGLLDYYLLGPLAKVAQTRFSSTDFTLRDRLGSGNYGQGEGGSRSGRLQWLASAPSRASQRSGGAFGAAARAWCPAQM